MKKVFSIAAVVTCMCVSTVFAEYTLSPADTAVVQEVVQKLQAKPIRTQEAVIKALKNAQNKTNFTEQKKALFAAVETGLRKTSIVDGKTVVLATKMEREHIKKALVTENIDQKDGSVTLDISGKLTSTSTPKTLAFDTRMAVDVDMNDLKNPKVRLAVDASGSLDAENITGAGEMRVVDALGFFKLTKLASTSPDIRDEMVALQPYLNIWWKVPLSETDLVDIATTNDAVVQNDDTIMKTLLSTNFIPVLQYMGQEKGVSTYGGTIDNKALLAVIKEAALSEGEIITDQDIIEAQGMLRNVSIFTKFSLTDKNIFSAVSMTTTVRPTVVAPGNTIQGNISVDMTISPLKNPIVAPANAQEFREEALMGM